MDPQSQQSELKRLIIKGKEQGFLTYREMGTVDLLPRQDEINLAKRIEDGIRQIEAKALRKMRHPTRSERLRSYLDQ